MAKTKQGDELEIQVDGETYVWWLHRQPGWSTEAPVRYGMTIAVRHSEGQREVLIEFPPGPPPRHGAPPLRAARVDLKLVKNAIASAIAAGWEPLSRGKTVAIVVDATGA
jgi:hypothetical protein